MKKIFEKKRLGLSCLAMVAAIVIGVCVGTGCGEKNPNPTEGTSNVGDPTETTGGNGNEVTDPSDPSDNTDEPLLPDGPEVPFDPEDTEGTEPGETNPTDPSEPQKPDDYVEPSEPDATIPEPTEPEPGTEPDPTDPTAPKPEDDPIVGAERDFDGYTAGTITYDVWNSWSGDTRQAFIDEFFPNITPEDYHNFMRQTKYKGYSCGFERHTCGSESTHNSFMEDLARGCEYCGKSDCDSFFVVNPKTLFTSIDFSKCPEYDIHKDPCYYCQTCGLPTSGESGTVCCHWYIVDATCSWCGKPVKAYECHECVKP